MHRDVIMDCLEDPDISIRLQALDLGAGLVDSDSLVPIVDHMVRQLTQSPILPGNVSDQRGHTIGVEPAADSDGEDPEETLRPTAEHPDAAPAFPPEYREEMIRQIVQMCSKDTYSNVTDFEWYIDVIVQLIGVTRIVVPCLSEKETMDSDDLQGKANRQGSNMESVLGWELRNVAVRVQNVRPEAVKAAYSLLAAFTNTASQSSNGLTEHEILTSAVWIVGEYCGYNGLASINLDPLIHPKVQSLPPLAICAYLQAIPKVLTALTSGDQHWSSERQSMSSLLLARIIHFLEPLGAHPHIEVQERSVQLLELIRIAAQALAGQESQDEHAPPLLTRVVPQLFVGFTLNPVAVAAQKKVPLPDNVDLNAPINDNLGILLDDSTESLSTDNGVDEFESFYSHRSMIASNGPAIDTLPSIEVESSYQGTNDGLDDDTRIRNRTQRRNRNKDDPFYIGSDDASGPPTPFHEILKNANGNDVDVDSIPIMNLDLEDNKFIAEKSHLVTSNLRQNAPKKFHVIQDENIMEDDAPAKERQSRAKTPGNTSSSLSATRNKARNPLLQVDSSGISRLSLHEEISSNDLLPSQQDEVQDMEMAKALAEVERLRLEMQRASERIQSTDGTPSEGTFIKKKKKKRKVEAPTDGSRFNADGAPTDSPPVTIDGAEEPQMVKAKKKTKKTKKQKSADKPSSNLEIG